MAKAGLRSNWSRKWCRAVLTVSRAGVVYAALFSLVYGLTVALAPVRANVLPPGWIDAPIWDNPALAANKPAMFAQMAQRLPAGRIGHPSEIGHAALFLMENEFSNGVVLPVDGG